MSRFVSGAPRRGAGRAVRLITLAVLALTLILPLVPPAPAAALATPEFFGLVGRDPWYEFDPQSGQPKYAFQEAMMRNIAASGARWLRIEFHTAYFNEGVRKAGQITYAETDYLINELAPRYGVKVLALLNTGILSDQPPFSYSVRDLAGDSISLRDRYINAFAARSQEIAARYAGRIDAYEILNEPNVNVDLYWSTGDLPTRKQEIPPHVFGQLLVSTHHAIRAVDGSTPLVLGGLLKGYPIDQPNRYTTDYLHAVYNAPAVTSFRSSRGYLPFDGVGLHPYPDTSLPQGQWLGDTLGLVEGIGAVMSQAGDPGKLWLTEIGVKATPASAPVAPATASESFQSAWLRDLYTALATTYAGRVARAFWFKYEDFPPGNPTETWGLVRLAQVGEEYAPDGSVQRVKPGYVTLHDLAFTPASTWYFAEGYTGGDFDEYLTIQNPGGSDALVVVTYLPTGAAPVARSLIVGARSRATVSVHDLSQGVGEGWPVAARVTATAPVVVERPMYFSYGSGVTGGHVAVGATAPATRWYFAEGYTGDGFDMYLTLQNPAPNPVSVTVTYLFAEGGRQQTVLGLAGQSRHTIAVHDVVGRGRAVSAVVESTGGIIAERPMYFRYGDGITGGHVALGARTTATTWYFAEGFTGDGFDQYFSILNPGATSATVTITYYLPGDQTEQRTMTVGAGRRGTVFVHDAAAPGGLGRGYANSARLQSNVPIVAERPMYFRYTLRDGRAVDGGHLAMGATALGTSYGFAEGFTGEGFDEYLTIQNPDSTSNRIRLTFQLADGRTVVRERIVAARSRDTVRVHDPAEGVGPGQAVAATVASLEGEAFLVERPMYFSYGPGWTGGHVAIGYPG